ncbi:restriction endonuclease [Nostoc sp. CHAB 5836]|uniref:restriction endonuclease n=1 Tax=Nostoc sp. CHAB 5836 TaxID=2780404 RepID=UPI001E63615F|nr:restriction endonuclease [Nostoc sp. CHAB 5836]MCC5618576.1 restriction endonuclease [Nostoc sp. CHAB 5836]
MSEPINSPIQKILFGSPGTGKSHRVHEIIVPQNLRITNQDNIIRTVFHPEYTYGDFLGKLVPLTKAGKVEYKYYTGHFLKALAKAYIRIYKAHDKDGNKISEPENVALIIDEINRGNSSAIFGTIFQLLDRKENGWSSYGISLTEIEFNNLLSLIGTKFNYDEKGDICEYKLPPHEGVTKLETLQKKISFLNFDLVNQTILLPPNLSIIGTMNTSDNSIYFMDSAFKRRWDWEFVDWDENTILPEGIYGKAGNGTLDEEEWKTFVRKLNTFIKSQHAFVRGIEDKQVGNYFIKERPVKAEQIRNKLMFFLWDSVFNRDKKPLRKILGVIEEKELVTFGDFTRMHNIFVKEIMKSKIDE